MAGSKTRSKHDLPAKVCATCGRPFTYRKKWRNCWEEVKYCGEKCQRHRGKAPPDEAAGKPLSG
ncbi:DUF2256 domain-containing protein [Hymenobacter sp. BT730]|uniref:DUF2256 domain-containing protein n=1 Tax=Hymenobacter sp. BT730 TaxID=3063332 RepID=UPI0026DF223A|nr:DUF2256 domain-containing protein [Hymenobacter sp. BT730]